MLWAHPSFMLHMSKELYLEVYSTHKNLAETLVYEI
jgi:hypothetical protein